MFYSIRELMDEEAWVPTGQYWVGWAFDAEASLAGRSDRNFDTLEEAKAEYPFVEWGEPDAEAEPSVVATGWDE